MRTRKGGDLAQGPLSDLSISSAEWVAYREEDEAAASRASSTET